MAKKTISIALSGSGFKFPAHVGALLAVEEEGFEVIELAGTSGGSIVAALSACGKSPEELKELTLSRDWSDMMSFNFIKLFFSLGMCDGNNLLDFMQEQTHNKTFSQLPFPLTILASDITNGKPFLMSPDTTPGVKVAEACRASASIPFIYTPAKIDGCSLVDGTVVNDIPVDRLTVAADLTLGVQLVAKAPGPSKPVSGLKDLGERTVDLMMTAGDNAHVSAAKQRGSKVVFVETGYASTLDRNMSTELRQQLLADGYKAVKAALVG